MNATKQVHRCVWLVVRLLTDKTVHFEAYHAHFGSTLRTYYRDLSILQRVGLKIESRRDHGGLVALVEVAL